MPAQRPEAGKATYGATVPALRPEDAEGGDVTSIRLYGHQASLVECDIIEGWLCDDVAADMVPAIEAHYQATGQLLVVDADRMVAELIDLANVFDAGGDYTMYRSAAALATRVRKVSP